MKLLITVINIWVIRGSPPSWPYRFSPSYPEAVLYLGRHLLAKHDELDQNFLLYLLKNGSSYSNITSKSIEWLISLLQHENIFELKIEPSWKKKNMFWTLMSLSYELAPRHYRERKGYQIRLLPNGSLLPLSTCEG